MSVGKGSCESENCMGDFTSNKEFYTDYLGAHSIQANGNETVASSLKSPVSFVFGGIGAMFALIIFAFIVLACSYWRKMSPVDVGLNNNGMHNSESHDCSRKIENVWCDIEKGDVMVVMAGHEKPTYMGQPMPFHATDHTSEILSFVENTSFSSPSSPYVNGEK
ncbi:hypothetical protein SUGI_0896510 [Cryptomeria japonica]|nr:hypothetical protein SUGI_0896510 [Cryptomeria japonica]